MPKVVRVMTFGREEILYDVANIAYVAGDVSPKDDHEKHQLIDIIQDGNVDRVTRVMTLAFSEVVEILHRFTKVEVGKTGMPGRWELTSGFAGIPLNNEFIEPDQYHVIMRVPATYSETTLVVLKNYIHEYVCCSILADWMSITNKEEWETWVAKREEVKEKLNGYKEAGTKARIVLHPAW